jgi:hypothetical protein
MSTLASHLNALVPDKWRNDHPFSADLKTCNDEIFASSSAEATSRALEEWLAKNQPCLFGRIAAKRDLLSFCILTEADIRRGDDAVRDAVQEGRRRWTADTFRGRKSGFIILLQSERVALAAPDQALLALAQGLASLYLLEDVRPNAIYSEEAFLEAPGDPPRAWKWSAGVNFFGAQGDGRWWQDHRIPGGIGFSVNSVGHMVKSGILARAMADMSTKLEIEGPDGVPAIVDSLPKALEMAMRTIALATPTPWGRATELVPNSGDSSLPACPTKLPGFLSGSNHCVYRGWYHTDETLPAEYFSTSPAKPETASARSLDFTYLFHDNVDNPDHERMGKGIRIRAEGEQDDASLKRSRVDEIEIEVRTSDRLRDALGR